MSADAAFGWLVLAIFVCLLLLWLFSYLDGNYIPGGSSRRSQKRAAKARERERAAAEARYQQQRLVDAQQEQQRQREALKRQLQRGIQDSATVMERARQEISRAAAQRLANKEEGASEDR
jgi:biopolymer transport protein ExbB/TolQ